MGLFGSVPVNRGDSCGAGGGIRFSSSICYSPWLLPRPIIPLFRLPSLQFHSFPTFPWLKKPLCLQVGILTVLWGTPLTGADLSVGAGGLLPAGEWLMTLLRHPAPMVWAQVTGELRIGLSLWYILFHLHVHYPEYYPPCLLCPGKMVFCFLHSVRIQIYPLVSMFLFCIMSSNFCIWMCSV